MALDKQEFLQQYVLNRARGLSERVSSTSYGNFTLEACSEWRSMQMFIKEADDNA